MAGCFADALLRPLPRVRIPAITARPVSCPSRGSRCPAVPWAVAVAVAVAGAVAELPGVAGVPLPRRATVQALHNGSVRTGQVKSLVRQ